MAIQKLFGGHYLCFFQFSSTSDLLSKYELINQLTKQPFHSFNKVYQFRYIYFFSYIWRDSNLDTAEERRWTWLLVLLSIWPQYQAYKLIKRIFKYKRMGIYRDNEDLKRQHQVFLNIFYSPIYSFSAN